MRRLGCLAQMFNYMIVKLSRHYLNASANEIAASVFGNQWRELKAIKAARKHSHAFIQWKWSNAGVSLMSSRTPVCDLRSSVALLKDPQL